MIFRFVLALLLTAIVRPARCVELTRALPLVPGRPSEARALVADTGSTVVGAERRAPVGGGWTYRFFAPPGSRCSVMFSGEGPPTVTAAIEGGVDLAPRERVEGANHIVEVDVPAATSPGCVVRFRFEAVAAAIVVRGVRFAVAMVDSNGDGITDAVDAMLGLKAGAVPDTTPRPARPTTSFQTGAPYAPELAPPTGAALLYSSSADVFRSFADTGIIPQCMGGFRDGPEYARQYPGDVQTDSAGRLIEIGGSSYYLAPSARRTEIVRRYYADAIAAGATAICPEEPEYWAHAGYEDAFRQEWQRQYNTPWRAPAADIDSRWRAEGLKAQLETRLVADCLSEAMQRNDSVTRMVAIHSPVNYAGWGIATPHAQLARLPALQELIGQVWTGTARWPVRHAGVRSERTFELGYLEHSSLFHLLRGTGKRLWFLMDPVEDSPDRTMEDYRYNYLQTLAASLMFPEVDCFEVMPWPERVYGRVPGPYATVVNTVVGTLGDVWRFSGGSVEAGSSTVGTFVSDSMGRQRGAPSASDMDGFFALAMPFVARGVPVKVLSLDRVTEPGYLDVCKLLVMSYDYLKPVDVAQSRAIAAWVRRGGTLIVAGGTDAYNGIADGCWRSAGYAGPVEQLLGELGVVVQRPFVLETAADPETPAAPALLRGSGTERSQANRSRYTADITRLAAQTGSVIIRFADVSREDGWGPYLRSLELRSGDRVLAAFRPGSEIETRFLWDERDTRFDGTGRFADGGAYWEYRFDSLPRDRPVTIAADVANGYLVTARAAAQRPTVLSATDTGYPRAVSRLRLPPRTALSLFQPPASASPLFQVPASASPAVWRTSVGQGSVTVVGVAPGALSMTSHASRWFFVLARRALEQNRGSLRTANAFVCRRGPYVAARTLGRELKLDGLYVDLLSPDLSVRDDPVVPPRTAALFQRVRSGDGASPRLLAASGRVRARVEQNALTGFVVEAPTQTEGAARVWCGKRGLRQAVGFTALGAPVTVTAEASGDTLLLRYPNAAEGVVVRLEWK